jgi:hypothetical protein
VQITTWAGAYSRREWSGMIKGYYQAKTRIWLNATLQQAAAAATVARLDTKVLDGAARYSAYGGFDCNFADIGDRKELCTARARRTASRLSRPRATPTPSASASTIQAIF